MGFKFLAWKDGGVTFGKNPAFHVRAPLAAITALLTMLLPSSTDRSTT